MKQHYWMLCALIGLYQGWEQYHWARVERMKVLPAIASAFIFGPVIAFTWPLLIVFYLCVREVRP